MDAVLGTPGPLAPPPIARSAALPMLGRNLATAAGDYGRRLVQDNGSLKGNIAVIGILIQVIARIIVAYASAQKAKGTPEEDYRRMEFIRTTIRESLGWTFGFGGFRLFDLMIKKGVRAFLELPAAPVRHSRIARERMAADIKAWMNGTLTPRAKESGLIALASQSFDSHISPEALQKKPFGTTAMRLINLFSHQTPSAAFASKLKTFYTWFPTTVGAILSVSLAGFWLERFSIDHSREAARFIDKILNGGKSPSPVAAPMAPAPRAQGIGPSLGMAATSYVPVTRPQGFGEYMNRVQQQRSLLA